MIQNIEGKELHLHDKVQCYRNLHTSNFSLRNAKSKLVVARGNSFVLVNVVPKISEKSRQRVIQQKQRNVHAMLVGDYVGTDSIDISNLDEIYYNPYHYDSFINKRTGEKISSVEKVYFLDNRVYIIE